jgi:uncharacterized protein (DUF362 family)
MERFADLVESVLKKRLSRKSFIKLCLGALAMLPFLGRFSKVFGAAGGQAVFNGRPKRGIKGEYDLVIARGEDPYRMTAKAIEAMGGMGRFVKKGDVVLVKPNMAWDRTPEQAANTNPQVIAALVELSYKAGARRVNVFDLPCNEARRTYVTSGIAEAARAAGAEVYFANEEDVVEAHFEYPSPLEGWPLLRDAIECDVLINAPVLKHHSLTNLTLSMKNLMGVCAGNRGLIHHDIGRKLVDLTDFMNPDLTVIDAFRVLVRHGPTGGSLDDVQMVKALVVATDPTLADTYACGLVNVDPQSVSYIKNAIERKFGNSDVKNARKLEIEA